jgi:3'-5' exoribonuclease
VPTVLLRDLTDGQAVDQVLLVAEAEVRSRRSGEAFLRLVLSDRTGRVTAMVWEDHERLVEHLVPGRAVRVRGTFCVHPKFGGQLDGCTFLRPVEGSYDEADLRDGPPRPAALMEADLRALVDTVQDPWLRELLDRVLGPHTETWEQYRAWPAAKRFHQAYVHGLLEHSLTVAQGVSAMSSTFPGIDRDVAVTGALLHDIGKLEAYASQDGAIDMTDAGKLEGEIPLGYYRIRRAIEDLPGFPAATAQAVLHIILAHHGSLEHGSPVVPCTREATLVHFVDNLGGRLGSFDRLEKELAPGADWSSFDRGVGGSAFFGGRRAHAAEAPAELGPTAPASALATAAAASPVAAPAAAAAPPVAPPAVAMQPAAAGPAFAGPPAAAAAPAVAPPISPPEVAPAAHAAATEPASLPVDPGPEHLRLELDVA